MKKAMLFLILIIFLFSSPTQTYTNNSTDNVIKVEISNKKEKNFDMFITDLKNINMKSKVREINKNYLFLYSDLEKKVCRLKIEFKGDSELDISIIECFEASLEGKYLKIN